MGGVGVLNPMCTRLHMYTRADSKYVGVADHISTPKTFFKVHVVCIALPKAMWARGGGGVIKPV